MKIWDDYLDSFENVTHAFKISRDLVSLLKLGGINLTKFVSNADEITSAMNPQECKTSSSLGRFFRKPSRIAFGLLIRAFSGLLISRLYPSNV